VASLYVTEQGSKIRKSGGLVCVYKEDEEIERIQANKLDQIVVFGNISLTTPIMIYCLKNGIDVLFLSNNGSYCGRLQGPESGNPVLRHDQLHATDNESFRLGMAKSFISGKISNMHVVLLRHAMGDNVIRESADLLEGFKKKVLSAENVSKIRGFEGSASRCYFGVLGRLLKDNSDAFRITGRHRRPPTDPVNCLLSFSYTLLYYELLSSVYVSGLDPYLGFLHEKKYGRPSLALDLMEEYRPLLIDSLVISCINKKVMKESDFHKEKNNAILLTDEGRRKFLGQYEHRLITRFTYGTRKERITYRLSLSRQVAQLCRIIRGEQSEYKPVSFR